MRWWTLVGIGLLCPGSVSLAQSWAEKAPMPTARLGLATCSVDGKLYAIGGYSEANRPGLRTVEEYDPETDAWRTRADMPTGRRWLAAGAVEGKCYAIGGHIGPSEPGLATVEEYDPATDSWRTRADMPSGHAGLAAAVADGLIYVVGGGMTTDSLTGALAVYDPAADSWTTQADMPTPRGVLAAAAMNGKVYAIGGVGGTRTLEEYDPATDTWSAGANMPTGRVGLSASTVDGRVYVMGGKREDDSPALANVQAYDPADDAWTAESALPSARWGLASSEVEQRIYAIGGSDIGPPPHPGLTSCEQYTPPATNPETVRRCFFDAETLAPVFDVRVEPGTGPSLSLGASNCSSDVPFDVLTLEAPGYRKRETHAANGKNAETRAALPGENGLHFGLFPEDSDFTDLVDSGRTIGNKKKRGFLQGLPYFKFEILRPADFPMPTGDIKRSAKKELRKRAKFRKPVLGLGDAITAENQILLRHVPGAGPSVDCTILHDGVCWGPVVSFDAVAGDPRAALEEGLRRIFFHGKDLVSRESDIKAFYRGFQASVVGQRLKRGKESDVKPGSSF